VKKEKPVHSEIYNGVNINILHDPDAPNPRTEFDNLGHMVYWRGAPDVPDGPFESCFGNDTIQRSLGLRAGGSYLRYA